VEKSIIQAKNKATFLWHIGGYTHLPEERDALAWLGFQLAFIQARLIEAQQLF
jgi:hypothetical protein